jgi:hypothetical protein
VGSTATGFFCGAVARGSSLLTAITGNPSPMLIVLGVIVVLLLWLASRTRWGPASPSPVRTRRRWGTIVIAASRFYRGHLRLVLGLGVVFIPLGLLITGVQYLVFRVSGLSSLVETEGASNAFVGGLAILLGAIFTGIGLAIVQATCAAALDALGEGRELRALEAYKVALRRWRPLLGAFLLAAVVVGILSFTAIGLILVVWLLVRWALIAQVVILEGNSPRAALRRSSQLVRGDWWRVASLVLFVTTIGLLLGPLLGAILLFATSASFNFVNLISSLVYVFALPFVAIATTYLYFDLELEKGEQPEREAVAVPAPT